ncbi:hypothetical protein WR25_11077 isoform A [Diploscapter pachys]|uniref:Protein alan shepard n=1 Tax=Diploscapter pachys TaxID=2018661 RepID=A0A2A2L3F8_9BILA|nr:hypothetical protein WR25_11077 isoform A [Diploscapter pachys]
MNNNTHHQHSAQGAGGRQYYNSYNRNYNNNGGYQNSGGMSGNMRSVGSYGAGITRDGTPLQDSTPLSATNLYIRGLPPNTTDEDLRQMCQEFGAIASTKAIMDKQTNQCKGYGFVDFESREAAARAVEELNGRNIQAQMAKQQEQDPTNLYIANLPPHYNEQALESVLQKYGMVVSTRILRNADGQSRGVGFARMDSKEKCEEIINALNGGRLEDMNPDMPALLVKQADTGRNSTRKRSDNLVFDLNTGGMFQQEFQPFIGTNDYRRNMSAVPQVYQATPYMNYNMGYQQVNYPYDLNTMTSQMSSLQLNAAPTAGTTDSGIYVYGAAATAAPTQQYYMGARKPYTTTSNYDMMAGGTGPTAQGMNNNMAAMGYGAPQQVSIDDYHRKGIAQNGTQ